jgi:hypothetical protein
MTEHQRVWRRVEQAARRLADAELELDDALAAAQHTREQAADRPRLHLLDGGQEHAA